MEIISSGGGIEGFINPSDTITFTTPFFCDQLLNQSCLGEKFLFPLLGTKIITIFHIPPTIKYIVESSDDGHFSHNYVNSLFKTDYNKKGLGMHPYRWGWRASS